ncbi:MAG: 2-dehydropantoate 2-reductase [Paraglaciecola sp.]
MNIAIVGNGAIGNLLAANCQRLGLNYHLLTRNGLGLELSIRRFKQDQQHFTPSVKSVHAPGDFDMLVLPLKAYQIVPAIEQLRAHLQPRQTVVLLHNGMGSIEHVKLLLPHNPIVAATTSYAAYKPTAQTLIETGLGQTHCGWVSTNASWHREQVESRLSALLPPCTWHQDIQLALWNKLAINAVINPLSAIEHITNGQLKAKQYQQHIAQLCAENARVMQACGFATSAAALLEKVHTVIRDTAQNFSSMNRDIAFGRPSEIDYINGYLVQQAQQHDIAAPLNTRLVSAIKHLEALKKDA